MGPSCSSNRHARQVFGCRGGGVGQLIAQLPHRDPPLFFVRIFYSCPKYKWGSSLQVALLLLLLLATAASSAAVQMLQHAS